MPHIPRQFASTVGMPPETMTGSRAPAPAAAAKDDNEGRTRLDSPKLSMRRFKKTPAEIAAALFGKESRVEPYSKQLVP